MCSREKIHRFILMLFSVLLNLREKSRAAEPPTNLIMNVLVSFKEKRHNCESFQLIN